MTGGAPDRTADDVGLPLFPWLVPAALSTMLIARASSSRSAGPVSSLAAAVLLAALVSIAVAMLSRLRLDASRYVAVAAIPVALLLVSSLRAVNSQVAVFGLAGQHSGWLTWFAAWAWFGLTTVTGSPRSTRNVIRTVALLGAFVALSVAADAVGLLPVAHRYSIEPAGLFENSITASHFLLLGIACAASWAAMQRPRAESLAAWSALIVCGAGLALTRSTASYVGLAAGSLAWFSTGLWRLKGARAAVTAIAIPAGAGLAVAAALRTAAPALMRSLSNGRFTIWRSALAAGMQHPLLGRGADQFSAWWRWAARGGMLDYGGAYDPHCVPLAWFVAGGFLGLAAFIAAAAHLGAGLVRVVRSSRSPAMEAATAGLVALTIALLFSWADPLPLVTAATLAGALLAAGTRPAAKSPGGKALGIRTRTAMAGIALSTMVILAALFARATIRELAWAQDPTAADAASALERARASDDPAYRQQALDRVLSSTGGGPSAESMRTAFALAADRPQDATWHVDFALVRIQLLLLSDNGDRAAFEATVDDARKADPGTAMWDYIAAEHAAALGRAAEARSYSRSALRLSLPSDLRPRMRRLAR